MEVNKICFHFLVYNSVNKLWVSSNCITIQSSRCKIFAANGKSAVSPGNNGTKGKNRHAKLPAYLNDKKMVKINFIGILF